MFLQFISKFVKELYFLLVFAQCLCYFLTFYVIINTIIINTKI